MDNILLDTGCLRTLVHQEQVLRGRMLDGEAVAIPCAHGDSTVPASIVAGSSWYKNHGGKWQYLRLYPWMYSWELMFQNLQC